MIFLAPDTILGAGDKRPCVTPQPVESHVRKLHHYKTKTWPKMAKNNEGMCIHHKRTRQEASERISLPLDMIPLPHPMEEEREVVKSRGPRRCSSSPSLRSPPSVPSQTAQPYCLPDHSLLLPRLLPARPSPIQPSAWPPHPRPQQA